jgi:hypothetical protein
MSPRWIVAPLAITLVLVGSRLRAADDTRLSGAVQALFEAGWDGSYQSRSAADKQFQAVEQLASADPRAMYAYALVQIKQRRYSEAEKLISEILSSQPENIHALKARIWLSMMLKKYSAALVDMNQMSQQLPADEPARRELAKYFGRLFGFLEGPAQGAVGDAILERTRGQIVARIGADGAVLFEEARGAVIEQFSSLTSQQDQASQIAKQTAEDEQSRLADDLQTRTEKNIARADELNARRGKLREEAQSEMDYVSRLERPLLDQLAQLDGPASLARRELFLLWDQIGRIQRQAERERDPTLRGILFGEINRLQNLAARYDAELASIERRGAVLNSQRADLQRRRLQAQATFNGELARIEAELDDIQRQQKRVEGEQKRISRPTTGDTRRARALAAQAVAFTTYEDFPLEAERQRIVDSFR